MTPRLRWDIFCSVIDNFGDIGVCWRLARQLANEHGLQVRLWVDDLASFQRMAPIDPEREVQWLLGVEVRHWSKPFPELPMDEIPDVVIEAFAVPLPESYEQAMARRSPQPFWINLDHLSAEEWVEEYHALTSPHPRLPLTKHFFFPGFTSATGGLLRENDLLEQVRDFQGDDQARGAFWSSLGVHGLRAGELCVSLFAYGSHDLAGLLTTWRDCGASIRCLVPEGALATSVARELGHPLAKAHDTFSRGNLRVHVFPFLEQNIYDRLLWACDINFVRGEDSFVRAQWAMRPMIWQPYRQDEHHHDVKMEAFLDLYREGLPKSAEHALVKLWQAWTREEGVVETWGPFLAERETLATHARNWAERLAAYPDLATNLVHFTQKPL